MLANFHAEQPHQHAVYYTSVLMAEQAWTKDEMLECIEGNYIGSDEQGIPVYIKGLYFVFLDPTALEVCIYTIHPIHLPLTEPMSGLLVTNMGGGWQFCVGSWKSVENAVFFSLGSGIYTIRGEILIVNVLIAANLLLSK